MVISEQIYHSGKSPIRIATCKGASRPQCFAFMMWAEVGKTFQR